MQGAWIISRPLSAVGGRTAEDGTAGPVMQLSDFAASLEAIAARSPDPLAMWRAGEALQLALAVYPEAKVDVGETGLTLHPSRPPIPERAIGR